MFRFWRRLRTRELLLRRREAAPERSRPDARMVRRKPPADTDGAQRRLRQTVENNRIL
jgi:hypothetical protein